MMTFPLVLQLDISGNPVKWITYESSAYYYAKNLVAWSMGEVDFTIHGGTSRKTGEQSTLTMNTIIAIRGKVNTKQFAHNNRVPLSNKTLFRRDHHTCGYCGNVFSHNHLTRDHVLPSSRGGKNIWTNVVTACAYCNKAKDNKTPEEAHMELLYVPYIPNRAEYLLLANRKILADQMDFLKKQLPKNSRAHML